MLEQIKQEKQKLVKEGKLMKSALTDSVIFKGDDNKYYINIGLINLFMNHSEIVKDVPTIESINS